MEGIWGIRAGIFVLWLVQGVAAQCGNSAAVAVPTQY